MDLQNWIKKRYLTLLNQLKTEEFDFEMAARILQSRYKDKEDKTKLVLSELNKSGLLIVRRDKKDARKKIYRLIPLAETEKGIRNLSRKDLEGLLKKAADLIRTRVDYSFILLLLFYKRASDLWETEFKKIYQDALKDGFSPKEAKTEAQNPAYHRINIPEEFLWANMRKNPLKISENFSGAMKALSELNPDLKDIFQRFDFVEFANSPENTEILRQLLEVFSTYSLEHVSPDILGDAYEWILRYFAPQKAKEGEVYTPREVINLMIKILDPQPEESIYDVASGSAGMLIGAYKHIEEKYSPQETNKLFLYGQEQNFKTLALAKMNLLVHDIQNGHLLQGDTLLYPKFKEGQTFKKFNLVIANPPWNQDGYDEETLKKGEFWRERFFYGFTTRQSADWAWIQHMLASTEPKGKVAVVIDTGAVSRGGKEKGIRQKIIEEDLVEAVILLPEKLFYNTSAPGLIIIFNKNKQEKRKGKILLINASKEFQPGKPQNILGEKNIKKIAKIYHQWQESEGLSKIITLQEAQAADFNLSPSRFVSILESGTHRPLREIVSDLKDLDKKRKIIDKKVQKILQKLKY